LKRSGPLQRKTALKSTGKIKQGKSFSHEWPEATRPPLARSSLPRTPMKRRPKVARPGYNALRREVIQRDGGCVAEHLLPGVECRGGEEVHHLWRRSQGGPDEAWNLKTLCAAHHTWVHANIKEARKLDLLRSRGQTEPTV
jgi:5-methylcytosine-specific restriction endonuclease McrA